MINLKMKKIEAYTIIKMLYDFINNVLKYEKNSSQNINTNAKKIHKKII